MCMHTMLGGGVLIGAGGGGANVVDVLFWVFFEGFPKNIVLLVLMSALLLFVAAAVC